MLLRIHFLGALKNVVIKGMTLKLYPLIAYKIKNIFKEKSCRIFATKTNPKPLLYFGITKNNHSMQEILLKITYYGRGYRKALKKLTLFFLANPVPFSRQSNSSGYKTSSQKFLC